MKLWKDFSKKRIFTLQLRTINKRTTSRLIIVSFKVSRAYIKRGKLTHVTSKDSILAFSRSDFFYFGKKLYGKKYSFVNVNIFCHLLCEIICHSNCLRQCLSFCFHFLVSKWQKHFPWNLQKNFTFANGYFLPFQVLP
jgi:hypothetical protein